MQEENPQTGSQPQASSSGANEPTADKEWAEFQRDLDTLGRQLAELSTHTASLGGHLVSALQARFDEVKDRAMSFKQATEQQAEAARQAAWQQAGDAEGAFSEARTRSTEAARQVWERSQPLREGAKDVGEGLARAWTELRASFGKAAGRLHTESPSSPTNGPVPAPASDDRREG